MTSPLALFGGRRTFADPVTYKWPRITDVEEQAVLRQLHKGLSIYDKSGVVGDFEDAFAASHDMSYGLITSSGTAALHSAFYALGIGPGDEVICPTYTFFATATPLLQLGALPVLADCTPTGGLDATEINRLVTSRTKAVAVTHMWGLPCDMAEIAEACRQNNLYLVEDCSHAHGARYHDQFVGTFGDISAWSLQTHKLICAGEGGILLTNDRVFYDRAQLLGHFNKRAMKEISRDAPYYEYAISGLGLKYRAHPLGIAFALSQLPSLESWIMGKQINANRIRAITSTTPQIVPLHPDYDDRVSAYYAFVLTIDPKVTGFTSSQLEKALHAEGFMDIDVPRSTAPLHTLAAFQRPQSPVVTYSSNGLRGHYPVASTIFAQAIKLSVPVEQAGEQRSDDFMAAFEEVWAKVVPWLLENPQSHMVE